MNILFFQLKGDLAGRIMELDGGMYSRVGLQIDECMLLEAAPPAVRVIPIHVRAAESTRITVMTMPRAPLISPKSLVGKPYDWGWLDGKLAKVPNFYHCATLIGSIFGLIGPRHPDLSISELRGFCR